MHVVRNEQLKKLNAKAARKFEDQMLLHLDKYFHKQCRKMSEKEIRNVICYGVERAEHYGVDLEGEKTKYLNLMFVFGKDFDTNPAIKWLSDSFEIERSSKGAVNINRLYDIAIAHENEGRGLLDSKKLNSYGGK